MKDERVQEGILRLVRRLEPSLGRREPSLKDGFRIIREHGLEHKTLPELARLGLKRREF